MKFSTAVLLASALLCSTAFAQRIGWQPIPIIQPTPFNPPTISYTPIGPSTYGSDGSSSYQSGGTTSHSDGSSSYSTGTTTTHSDGTRTSIIGDTMYGQKPDGTQFYCRSVANQVVCKPR